MTEISTEDMQTVVSTKQKNSGFGVASFIMGITIGILLLVLFAIAGILSARTPGGMDKQSVQAMVIGLSIMALLFFDVISTVLGIVGLFQKDRKKLFAVLGTIFSSIILLVAVGVIILGIAVTRNAM